MTKITGYNLDLAKAVVHNSADSLVVSKTLILCINIYGENPPNPKSAKHYYKPYDDSANIKLTYFKRIILGNIT